MGTPAARPMEAHRQGSIPRDYSIAQKFVMVKLSDLLSSHEYLVSRAELERALVDFGWSKARTARIINGLIDASALYPWRPLRGGGPEMTRIAAHVETEISGWRMDLSSIPSGNISKTGKRLPKGFWEVKENRIAKTREFVESTGMRPEDITAQFMNRHFRSILRHVTRREALVEAGYMPKEVNPMEEHAPSGYYQSRENRVNAVLRLAHALGKPYRELSGRDMREHGLGGLLVDHYGSGAGRAKKEVEGYLASHPLLRVHN